MYFSKLHFNVYLQVNNITQIFYMRNTIFLFALLMSFTQIYSQKAKIVSRDWVSFSQKLDIVSETEKKFKITASVKVETEDPQAWAGIWVRIDNKNDEDGFFDNMSDRKIKSNRWQSYTIEGIINSNSKKINLGGLCVMNGKFYFDNFKLFIEDDNNELKEIVIDNPSFEDKVSKGSIPSWNSLGTSDGKLVKVKEFDAFESNDSENGGSSLLFIGKGNKPRINSIVSNEENSPQITAMISMLEDLKNRVERKVKNMNTYEIDYLHDEKANRIGALVMHLAAAEVYYQVYTFEGRGFNDEEKEKWGIALDLGDKAREKYKGHSIDYYLDEYNKVREKTIKELKKRNDDWFKEVQPLYGKSNHYCWFHVMEHQSSHLGQILFLHKRIPPEVAIEEPVKKID